MAYYDYLRDRAALQRVSISTDSGGNQTPTWATLVTIPCRVTTVDSKTNEVYRREGHTQTVRLLFKDKIVRTDGETSLQNLLLAEEKHRFRFLFNGRAMHTISIKRQSEGLHDYLADIIIVDCEDHAEDVGYTDI